MKSSTKKGTYIFIFRLLKEKRIKTRGNKEFFLSPGVYLYVGSAFGPGGIDKRVGRHLKKNKPLRWHLDYITASEDWEFLGCIPFFEKRWECGIAALLNSLGIFEPVKGFGCSDCKCESHLFKVNYTSLK